MTDRHFGLSVPTQRRLFAVHLTKTTDRPHYRSNWLFVAALFFCAACWAFAIAGLFL